MDIKKYLEEKKGNVTKKAKQVALTGLAAATILGGVAGLTSCDRNIEADDTPAKTGLQEPISVGYPVIESIENLFKDQKEDFDLNYVGVNKYKEQYWIDLIQKQNDNLADALAWGSCVIDEESYNQLYALYEKNPGKIKAVEREIIDKATGECNTLYDIELSDDDIVDESSAEFMHLIYFIIKDNPNLTFVIAEEAEMVD